MKMMLRHQRFGVPNFWTNQKLDEIGNFDGGVSDIQLSFCGCLGLAIGMPLVMLLCPRLAIGHLLFCEFRGFSLLRTSMPSMDV